MDLIDTTGSGLWIRYRIRNIRKNQSFEFSLIILINSKKSVKKLKINYGTKMYELLVNFYLLMVGKKDGFEVVVLDRGVVVRKVDGVVDVVDVVQVVVRIVVGGSVILGTL